MGVRLPCRQHGDVPCVRVKPGHYALKRTLVFTPADSGTPETPVTWIGEDDAVLAGGEILKGWKDEGNGVWSVPLPRTPDGQPAHFEQLWVNGRRADRARLPNKGHFRVPKSSCEADPSVKGRFVECVTITNAEIAVLGRLAKEEFSAAQMCVVHKWSFARRILRNFDAATGTVETWSPEKLVAWQIWNERETLVHFENVRSAFDAPGEWFRDARADKVLYRPRPGEDMTRVRVVAPNSKLGRLIEFRGEPDKDAYVHDIVFRNISFAYSDATGRQESTESWQLQAASGSDGVVTAEGVRRISFDGCRVCNTGNYAMRFNDGCTSNTVVNCTLEDLGAGGVWMGASHGYVRAGETLTRRVIRNLAPRSTAFNVIHDVNSFSYGGWGFYCDEGSEGIVMERNLVTIRTCHFLVRDIPCSLHFVNNIVIVGSSPLVGRGPCSVAGIWANNLWWNAVTSPELDGLDWARWAVSGKETGGRYADPQFVNAAAYDFRLKPTSPAFALGFKAWDFAQAGLRK